MTSPPDKKASTKFTALMAIIFGTLAIAGNLYLLASSQSYYPITFPGGCVAIFVGVYALIFFPKNEPFDTVVKDLSTFAKILGLVVIGLGFLAGSFLEKWALANL